METSRQTTPVDQTTVTSSDSVTSSASETPDSSQPGADTELSGGDGIILVTDGNATMGKFLYIEYSKPPLTGFIVSMYLNQ